MIQRPVAIFAVCLSIGASSLVFAQTDRRLAVGGTPERRLALVIGNDSYREAALQNARNDARAIASALEAVGFRVTLVEDANRRTLAAAVATFGNALQPNDVALFYFAGHGAQVDAENFLIPVDFQGHSAAEIRLDGLRAVEVQQLLQPARVSLFILDACRNNPFTGARAGGGGLATMEARGSLIAFATGAGQTAADNSTGKNGLFTSELLKTLQEPGLTAQELFQRVRRGVFAASNGRQFPAVYDGLLGDFVFRPAAAVTTATPTTPRDDRSREEIVFWESIAQSRSVKLFQEYESRYGPNGRFSVIARERIAELTPASPAPVARERIVESAPASPLTRAEPEVPAAAATTRRPSGSATIEVLNDSIGIAESLDAVLQETRDTSGLPPGVAVRKVSAFNRPTAQSEAWVGIGNVTRSIARPGSETQCLVVLDVSMQVVGRSSGPRKINAAAFARDQATACQNAQRDAASIVAGELARGLQR